MMDRLVFGMRLVSLAALLTCGLSACATSTQPVALVRTTVDELFRGDIDGVMTRVDVPFASSQGRVETTEELRAALEFQVPQIANRGYQVLSIARVSAEAPVPPGNQTWETEIAENPQLTPILVTVQHPAGRQIRYLTMVSRDGRIVALFD